MISGKTWELIQMLEVTPTTKFKKDLKKFKYQPKIIVELREILVLLSNKKSLAIKHVDHPLEGHWKSSREFHINPDLLLIYRIDEEQNKLYLERLGSHSELF